MLTIENMSRVCDKNRNVETDLSDGFNVLGPDWICLRSFPIFINVPGPNDLPISSEP